VGLALHEVEVGGKLEWQAQPLSPCCGDFMDNHGGVSIHDKSISAFCVACGEDWTELMFKCGATLYCSFDLAYVANSGKRWLSNMFGVSEDGLEVTVE
jgi:hypothetical protein